MLVLTRNIGESIFIGDDIKVTILARSSLTVRLGIEAPSQIVILREELKKNLYYPEPTIIQLSSITEENNAVGRG